MNSSRGSTSILVAVAIVGIVAIAALWLLQESWKTYYVEVWVRARFIDRAGNPVANLEVRTIPTRNGANEAWVQSVDQGMGAHDSEATAVSACGLTDDLGNVLLKVLVSSDSRRVRPFHGVHFVWIKDVGFIETQPIGKWKEPGGRKPFAVLDLGEIQVARKS